MMTTDNDGIGVVFRYSDRHNCYKLELDQQRSFRKLYKIVGGVETLLAQTGDGYYENQQIKIRVEVQGSTLRVAIGGADVFGAVTDDALTAGTVGVYSWAADGLYVDNLSVTPMGATCPSCPGGADDYRSCYDGPVGTADLGRCSSGEQLCDEGIWSVCLGQVLPAVEDCTDGLDNDCDGKTDEADFADCGCTSGVNRSCYDGPLDTAGVGLCREGEQTCAGGLWGTCLGQILPLLEECGDAEDNDCDGVTDDDCPEVSAAPTTTPSSGCDCNSTATAWPWWCLLLVLWRRRLG